MYTLELSHCIRYTSHNHECSLFAVPQRRRPICPYGVPGFGQWTGKWITIQLIIIYLVMQFIWILTIITINLSASLFSSRTFFFIHSQNHVVYLSIRFMILYQKYYTMIFENLYTRCINIIISFFSLFIVNIQ